MRIYSIGIFLLISMHLFSQEKPGYLEIVQTERELKTMFNKLYNVEITGTNMALFHAIDSLFYQALQLPGAFNHRWQSLDMIGNLISDDGQVKVFSWLYMASRDEYHYSAYMQVIDNKGEVKVFRLNPGTSEEIRSEEYPQSVDDWHGKVYYSLLTNKYKRKTFYTLLGADFKNTSTSIKTIEVFAIQRGKPVFRGDQFLDGGTVKDRIVLEYSAELTISVNYDARLGMIVFDHVVPLHPLYQGHFQFYGPDGSYNGYRFEEGVWVLEQNVDARNLN